jgi:hypothetical protein
VDPVSDPILLRISGRAGNQTQTSASVARNSDNYTTDAVVDYRNTLNIDMHF